jgi:hypothetical protein
MAARVASTTPRDRRTAKLDPTLNAFAERLIGLIDDPHFMVGQRATAGDEPKRPRVIGRNGSDLAGPFERPAGNAVDAGRSLDGADGERDRRFREAVRGTHGFGPETVWREPLREAVERVRAHRLGSVHGHAPAAEVEALDLDVGNPSRAQVEGKVWRRRNRAAALVNGP